LINQNKQTKKNLVFNIINLVVNIIIAILFIPYLVKSLGIVAYGIVPLALIVNQYIRVITVSLTNSLTRFYSISIEQNRPEDASNYLSSAFIVITIVVIVLAPFFAWIVLDIERIFNIPCEFINQAKSLFTFTLLGFVLSLYSSLINITLYAKNRLDALNVIGILRLSGKVVLTVSFFEIISTQVSFIGYANFISELLVLVLSVIYYKNTINKGVKISYKYYNKLALMSMLSMTIWVIIHQIGDTGLYRTDNILVNKFWNTRESGILGAISEFGTYVMMMVAVISSLFGPLILIAYSNGNHREVKKLTTRNSLWVGLLASLIVGVLAGFSQPLLGLWLGDEYIMYSDWFILKIITIPFYVSAGIFSFVFRAWNKILLPAIITLIIGLLNLIVCYLILSFADGKEIYIRYMLMSSVIFVLLQSYGLNSFWLSKLYPELRIELFYGFLKILIALILTSILSYSYNELFQVINLIELAFGFIIIAVMSIPLLFFILLKFDDRKTIINYFLIKINKTPI